MRGRLSRFTSCLQMAPSKTHVHEGKRPRFGFLLCLILTANGCDKGQSPPPQTDPRFVRQVEWMGKGSWLKADTHIHTKFSDGAYSVEEVVRQAERFGCDVVVITDHADRNLKAATREYLEAIQVERRRH